jgi:hypothetical protein
MQTITNRREALTRPCKASRDAPNQRSRPGNGVARRLHTALAPNFCVASPKLEATP